MQKTSPVTVNELRIFSAILTVGFLIIGILIPFLKGKDFHKWAVILAAVIFILGMLAPKLLIYPRLGWISVGNVMGKINSTIIFTLLYFVLFTTLGLIFRLLKRDRLKKKFRSVSSTLVIKNEISAFEEPF